MNAIVKHETVPQADMIRVLQGSLYPGAKPESVELVLAWCRATGRDPMKKPIHIVPTSVKIGERQWEMRDILMPGIGTYRTDAARTGEYAGKSEPQFGPDVTRRVGNVEMTYPQWCAITVQRAVAGQVRSFTAKEFWTENYATAGRDKDEPNAMWRKRPYGQLAKCAEAQALRMAFPDETGNSNTSEEMEGKHFEGVTIEAERPAVPERPPVPDVPSLEAPPPVDKLAAATVRLVDQINAAADEDALHAIAGRKDISDWRTKLRQSRPELEQRIAAAYGDRYAELTIGDADASGEQADADEPAPQGELVP